MDNLLLLAFVCLCPQLQLILLLLIFPLPLFDGSRHQLLSLFFKSLFIAWLFGTFVSPAIHNFPHPEEI
jgi:fucose permease